MYIYINIYIMWTFVSILILHEKMFLGMALLVIKIISSSKLDLWATLTQLCFSLGRFGKKLSITSMRFFLGESVRSHGATTGCSEAIFAGAHTQATLWWSGLPPLLGWLCAPCFRGCCGSEGEKMFCSCCFYCQGGCFPISKFPG